MFGKKDKKSKKMRKDVDKSGDWLDYISLHTNDFKDNAEYVLLNAYLKRHPDAVPAFANNVIFGNYKYWFLRHGEGLSYYDEEKDIMASLYIDE